MNNDADNSKTVAILAYFFVGIIWYFTDEKVKQSEFAKAHVKQALNLLIVLIIVMTVIDFIPLIEGLLV